MEEKTIITGVISKIIYQACDSLYKVFSVTEHDEEVICVGYIQSIDEGLSYILEGKFIEHKSYGRQFMVSSACKNVSNTRNGLISYLSSSLFPGIGEKIATKIVDELGNDCINKIIKDENCLIKISGLKEASKKILVEHLKDENLEEKIFLQLYDLNITSTYVYKIYELYGLDSIKIIKENPYRLIYDIKGFGFKKCDELAIQNGMSKNSLLRLKEALLYTLNAVCIKQGFTFLSTSQLIRSAYLLLNKDNELISMDELMHAFNCLIDDKRLIAEDDRVYEKRLYDCEIEIANKVKAINSNKCKKIESDKLIEAIKLSEKNLSIRYTDLQFEAIKNALSNNFCIITGGPGTGKTTILKGLLHSLAYINNIDIDSDEFESMTLLAAPTGRASKRMSESTLFKASTIHSALGYLKDSNTEDFIYNKDNLLPYSIIIIDEASMIDVELARALFNALSSKSKVILVGDENQLPSVGPGNVLHDLISSNQVRVVRLNQIMRQAEGSNIIKLSKQILDNNLTYSIFKEKNQAFFYNCNSEEVPEKLCVLIDAFIKSGGNLNTDLQILIPMYAGVAGIDNINQMIQKKYNNSDEYIILNDRIFKINDKVLQLVNNKELKVMNGDIGIIKGIFKDTDKSFLYIDFDGYMVKYPSKMIDDLKLAYAISIHKSQGSEYKNVILPIVPSYSIMLNKKIIYTAITRAKEKIIIIGNYNTLLNSLSQNDKIRQTTLNLRINDIKPFKKIIDKDIPFDTLGEENMDGITPYSFM